MQKFHSAKILLCLLLFAFPVAGSGDEIKLKSGATLEGRITYEADDIVKIELTISASIKETKIIPRGDIAEIIKEAPDNVAFREIQELLPIASLTPAGTYRTLIETGPTSFLRNFPDSVHTEKVNEIKAELDKELDKVERGFIKLEEEWLSPQEQAEFEALVSSRIRFLRMDASARSGNYNGIINAMREFEILESQFYGTPAFASGVELSLEAIPALGRQLQGMLRDVEYRNAEYERNKSALDEIARAQVEAARKREEDNYQAGLAADKKAGIKWVRLNSRSKPSIEAYLKLASSELSQIREYDLEQLKTQSEKLVEVDQLIAKGNYDLAKTKLADAAAITGKTAGSKSSSKSKGATSYIGALSNKLNDRIAEQTAREEAREAAAKSEALAANLSKKKESPADGEKDADSEAPEAEGETGTATEPKTEETPPSPEEMFAALSGKEKSTSKEKPKADSPAKKAKAEEETDRNGEDERDREPVVIDEGGGFPFSLIIPLITVLLLVTVIALKYFGIGTKKSDEDEAAGADE